jgi:hypothetical protein
MPEGVLFAGPWRSDRRDSDGRVLALDFADNNIKIGRRPEIS